MVNNLLATYRIDLIEVLAALVFLIVFKLVLVWGMSKISQFVQDDDTREASVNKPRKHLPRAFNVYRWILALFFLFNGLLQALPNAVGVSDQRLLAQYTGWLRHYGPGLAAAHTWSAHSIASNIWSVIIQIVLGVALLTFSQLWAVKIVSGLAALFSLFDWVILENFGNFGAANAGIFTGVPGPALLVGVLCALAFVPIPAWESLRIARIMKYVVAGYWVVILIVQWLPEDGYWKAAGFNQLKSASSVGSPSISIRHDILNDMASEPAQWNIVIGIIAILLALGSLLELNRSLMWAWFAVTVVWLAFLWIPSFHSGAGTLFVYPFGTGLAVIAYSILRFCRGEIRASEHKVSS